VHWWPLSKRVTDGPPPLDCSTLSGFDRDYCLIDRFEACAREAACPHTAGDCTPAGQVRAIGFARCVEFEHATDPKFNKPCATSNGFDADALDKCAAATSGADSATEIMAYIYKTANTSFSPIVTGFPDIRIDGVVQPNYWPNSVKDVERALCKAYTGAVKPPVCGQL